MNRRTLASLSLLGLFAAAPAAQAVFIPAQGSQPLPAHAGTGLDAEWFDHLPDLSTNAGARARIASRTPDAGFLASQIDYPRGATDVASKDTPLATFIAPDTIQRGNGSGDILDSVFRFRGFIKITDAFDISPGNGTIDVEFESSSDDGADVVINGVTVVNGDGIHPFNKPTVPGAARFEKPGLYPIEILFFNGPCFGGVEVFSTIAGGRTDSTGVGPVSIIPTEVLYPATRLEAPGERIPEPAALSLLAAATLMVRRRR